MRTHVAARAAAIILGLEAVGLVVLTVWQLVALSDGDTTSPASAIALAVLTLIGAVAVAAFAVGVIRGHSWGRSGGIVVQLLILAVALGAATGGYAHPLIGLALAAVGVIGLLPLIADVRRAGKERQDASEDARTSR